MRFGRLARSRRRGTPLALAAGCVLVLALSASAGAATRWSAPGAVATGQAADPRLAVSQDGHALLAWGQNVSDPGGGGSRLEIRLTLAHRPPGGRFSAPRRITHENYANYYTLIYTGQEALLSWAQKEDNLSATGQIRVARLSHTGDLGPIQTFTPPYPGAVPVLAANERGDAILAWREYFSERVMVSSRPPGGAFAEPVEVAPKAMGNLGVAISPRGDAAVTWERRAQEPPPPSDPNAPPPPPSGGMPVSEVTVRPAGGSFGPPEKLSDGGPPGKIAFDADGTLLAQGGTPQGGWGMRERPPGGQFGATQPIVAPGVRGRGFDLVEDRRGTVAVVWGQSGEGGGYYASIRPNGGDFGPPRRIASGVVDRDYEIRAGLSAGGRIVGAVLREDHWLGPRNPKMQVFGFVGGADRPVAEAEPLSSVGAFTPVAGIDAAGRAVAVWGHAPVGELCLDAAVFEDDPQRPSARPCDAAPPDVRLSGSTRQRLGRTIVVRARCDEHCELTASGKVSVGRRRASLSRARMTTGPNRTERLAVRVPASARRLVRRRGRARSRRPRASIVVVAEDASGNRRTARRTIHLRR